MRALLVENIHPDASARLAKEGYQVETLPRALGEDELIDALPGVSLLGIRSGTHVTGRVLDAAPELVAIGAFCIGVNQIDLAAASRRGMAVFNAPFSNTRSVVELAVAQIIAMARRLPEKNAQMHAGGVGQVGGREPRGARPHAGHRRLRQHRHPVVGAGRGPGHDRVLLRHRRQAGDRQRAVLLDADRAAGAGGDGQPARGRPGRQLGFFGAAEFAAMRPGSLFLNLSRGFVVDHAALRSHMDSGHIAGAAIDVFPEEPKGRGEEFVSELRGLPNVILTPHIGGSTEEAQQDIGEFVAGKLADYLASGATSLSVNLPGITLPVPGGTHRLVHLHRNVPGVLAAINRVLADHNVNVEGQLLRTRDDLGYVLTDIGSEYSADVLAELRAMPFTINLRTVHNLDPGRRHGIGPGCRRRRKRRGADEPIRAAPLLAAACAASRTLAANITRNADGAGKRWPARSPHAVTGAGRDQRVLAVARRHPAATGKALRPVRCRGPSPCHTSVSPLTV